MIEQRVVYCLKGADFDALNKLLADRWQVASVTAQFVATATERMSHLPEVNTYGGFVFVLTRLPRVDK